MNKSYIKLRTLNFESEKETNLQVIEKIENILGEFYGSKKLIFIDQIEKVKGGD